MTESIFNIPGWANLNFKELDIHEKIGGNKNIYNIPGIIWYWIIMKYLLLIKYWIGGGIGVIHKGYYHNEPVAIKTLFNPKVTNEVKQEYLDELLIMSKVNHSNIVKFIGACMTPPNLCFVMELCDKSVFEMLHVFKENITENEIIKIALDIGYAMEYLHSLKPIIIHRDLKSHNVLKDFNGNYKLCDFGLVMVKNNNSGTPAYMPPELLLNKSFNKSVDVYSYGIFLNELLTQEIPFGQLDLGEVRRRILNNERPQLPSLYGNRPNKSVQLVINCWYFVIIIIII